MASFIIEVPQNFNFEGTIRSYGFFLLAPNYYDRERHTFSRPLEVDSKVVHVEISSNKNASNSQANLNQVLTVKCNKNVSTKEQSALRVQITRILRLDATYMDEFHGIFPSAKEIGYGRVFRSPSLYEDIVKTMTNVNTTFARTQVMNTLICQNYGTEGSFPSASALGAISPEHIQENCSVGYRAARIVNFAKQVSEGKIDLGAIETLAEQYLQNKRDKKTDEVDVILAQLKKRLLSINGFGEFSANNVLQLLGIFDIIPSDSETARHLREHHKMNLKNPKDIHNEAQRLYAKYEPYQFLVYWYNLYNFNTKVKEGFVFELLAPPPSTISSSSSSSSTSSIITSAIITSTKVRKGGKKRTKMDDEKVIKGGQKRTKMDDETVEESPRRSKRLSMPKN